jgi:hypothetical protein
MRCPVGAPELPHFPQLLSCKVCPNACGSLWPFPFSGLVFLFFGLRSARRAFAFLSEGSEF